MRMDFRAKKTEAEWQATVDSFAVRVTPHWFNLMQWVLVVGVLAFTERKTGSVCVMIASAVSYGLLWLYVSTIFYKCEFDGLPFCRTAQAKSRASLCLSAALTVALLFVVNHVVTVLARP